MPRLLSSLPVGSLVKDAESKYYGAPIIWKVMEHGHTGDPAGSSALVTEKIISIKAFDAQEPNNSNSDRKSYGNNRYLYANLLQWLNSDAAAGKWYTAQHSADHAPDSTSYVTYNPYSAEAGFLSGFSENFKAAMMQATKRTVKSSTDGGSYEDITKKVHLLSSTEVGLANENSSYPEGSKYELFSDNASRVAYPTTEAVENSAYTNSSLNKSKPWYYWLRTPAASSAYGVRSVYTDGSRNSHGARNGHYGVRPACFVSSSIVVSDSVGEDGAYTIIWNMPPKITTEKELGDKNTPFNVEYSVTDPDGDSVTVTISLDGKVQEVVEQAEQGATLTHTVTGSVLGRLTLGTHTITIQAADSAGNTSEEVTFKKVASTTVISGSDEDIGTIWFAPDYTYTVTDSEGYSVTATEYIDGTETRTIKRADEQGSIAFDLSGFAELTNEEDHILTVRAVNTEGGEVYREIRFHKLPDRLQFQSKGIETDAAAERIMVNLMYDKTGNPKVMIEGTNNSESENPVWEDMTNDWKKGEPHYFENKPEDGFGVAIRVTIFKNETTQRVYCNGFGLCFT